MESTSNLSELSSRPVSRRGLRTNQSSPDGGIRPSTSSVFDNQRPESNIRIGTASRLASSITASQRSGSGNQRIGTALEYAGNFMKDRPITQQGLSGLPTSHGRLGGTANSMRVVKDKRYWQAILQTKINEINQETLKLLKETENMDRELSAKKIYHIKVKEAAKELTELQSQLADMNIAIDSFNSGKTRQDLQKETMALRERNELLQNELEAIFNERQIKEERNRQLEQEIKIEKNKINDMILSLPIEEQAKYKSLQELAEKLKTENLEMQNKIEILTKKKEQLYEIISNSEILTEAVKLQKQLKEATEKNKSLLEEEANTLTPEEEHEKLIKQVRMDNEALAAIRNQLKIANDELKVKKEGLQQIEQQDIEEGYTDRREKYRELKRRDETMTKFIEEFPKQYEIETEKLENLKNQIAFAIEEITLQGIDLKSFGIENPDVFNQKNDLSSEAGLLKEYKRLSIQLKQLQLLEQRHTKQLEDLIEEKEKLTNDIKKYSNLEQLRSQAAEDMAELTNQLEELRKKKRITEDVVAEAKKRNQDIKEQLRSNESYREISHLEENLADLTRENKILQEVVVQKRKENDYKAIRSEVEAKIDEFREIINKTN